MKIHLVVVAWGGAYVRLFLDLALPSMLSARNLPALCAEHEVCCRIYSTPSDLASMAEDPAFRRLQAMVAVEGVDIATLEREALDFFQHWEDGKFKTLSACHLSAMFSAAAVDAGLIFLMPDNIFSDGSLALVAERIAQGNRAVFTSRIQVLGDAFRKDFFNAFPADPPGVRTLPPRDLVRLALAHPHPWTDGLFLDRNPFQVCSQMYWSVGEEGFLSRTWHMHPFFIHPRRVPSAFFHSIDNDYTCQVLDPEDMLSAVWDSDALCCVEPLPQDAQQTVRTQPYPFTPLRWALASEGLFTSPHNFASATQSLRWHGAELTPRWEAVETQARVAIQSIQAWMAFLDPESPMRRGEPSVDLREAETMCSILREEAVQFEREGPPAPSPLYSWLNLAKLSAAMGRGSESRQALEEGLRVAPENVEAAIRISRLALRIQARPTAERAFQRVQELRPNHPRLPELASLIQGSGANSL